MAIHLEFIANSSEASQSSADELNNNAPTVEEFPEYNMETVMLLYADALSIPPQLLLTHFIDYSIESDVTVTVPNFISYCESCLDFIAATVEQFDENFVETDQS